MGINERDAKVLIASAIAAESYSILKGEKPFNPDRFIGNLRGYPTPQKWPPATEDPAT